MKAEVGALTMESLCARTGFTRLTLYWLPAVLWAVSISVVSHIPAQEIQEAAKIVDFPIALDIAYHVVAFAVMGVLGYRAASVHLGPHARLSYIAALVFAVGYGMIDELHQSLVSGRSSTIEDVGYDSLGAIAGLAAVFAIRVISSRMRGNPTKN